MLGEALVGPGRPSTCYADATTTCPQKTAKVIQVVNGSDGHPDPAQNHHCMQQLQMVRSFQEQKIGELPYAMQQPIDELPDAVFEVTAKFPMKRMPVGVPQQERLRPDTRETGAH